MSIECYVYFRAFPERAANLHAVKGIVMASNQERRVKLSTPTIVPFGPVDLIITNAVVLKKYSLAFEHSHASFELHLVTAGHSILHVDGESFPVSAGQFCWINPGVNRYVESNPMEECMHFVVHFDFLKRPYKDIYAIFDCQDIPAFLSVVRKKKVWISNGQNRGLNIYEYLQNEFENRSLGYMIVVRNMLCSLVVEAIQNIGYQEAPAKRDGEQPGQRLEYSILTYIRAHYAEDITIETVAKALNISTRHITRLLKEHFGTTFNSTLNSFRVAHVQERLISTDDSMDRIAEETGFSSTATMAANFKKVTGCTMQSYRRISKEKDS